MKINKMGKLSTKTVINKIASNLGSFFYIIVFIFAEVLLNFCIGTI